MDTNDMEADRPLTEDERALLAWLLEHGCPTPAEKAQLSSVRVAGHCDCGCRTVHLAVAGKQAPLARESAIIADFFGKDPNGVFVGVMLHVREGLLSELEVYSLNDVKTYALPRPEELQPSRRPQEQE